jgi:redox-sensitive bicupin YhaK (pirin superfamily)
VLLLTGEPLHEPVVGYGPFVMNTQQEIRQAIEDYRNGKMGKLNPRTFPAA